MSQQTASKLREARTEIRGLRSALDIALRDAEELANALRDVLAGHPVRNADELIARYSPLPERQSSTRGGNG